MKQRPGLLADCCFCEEIALNGIPDGFAGYCSLKSRIAFSSDNFVVLPSVSPLVEGHVLLLPKDHITSLAQLTEDNKKEFDSLLQFVYRKVDNLWSRPIIFEHGVGEGRTGGCGVTHAHLHMVPLPTVHRGSLWSAIIGELGALPSQGPLSEVLDNLYAEDSYLIVGDNTKQTSCCVREGLPSQMMRRLIAKTLSLSNWNWREMFNWAGFESTYYKLKDVA
jgi:diadenosine tetraphosphate (Ap4A) HIT family hydrolase